MSKQNVFHRHDVVSLEILNFLRYHKRRSIKGLSHKFTYISGVPVRISHSKYRYYIQDPTCSVCGLKGQFLAVERDIANEDHNYTFNLYGINEKGYEVLFNLDHIFRLTCYDCNHKRGNEDI